ncbi:T9SS type A sorting domain-containing protein [Pontimicrobium sp. SW4]|uniref:T9SS type A sorting domain-containing protein n=1 Tax=Pontimicrobium sp. SW4 TaxID=3153519 RepID=A0AAU7BSU3_9FLAO
MKKLYFLFSALIITSLSFGQKINEFEPNPAGTDPSNSTFELKGTPNTTFDLWILSIENDAGYNGIVDRASNVTGSFDANGLAVVTMPDLENPSFTVVLTDAFTGSTGDDLDPSNDGTFDTSSLGSILDAVGVSDSGGDDPTLYGNILGGTDILYNGEFEPLLAFRDGTTEDWYNTVTINFGQPDEEVVVFDASGNFVDKNQFDTDPTGGPSYGTPNASRSVASTKENQIEGFELYPNPSSEAFVNISSNNRTPMKVSVFDILGKQVIQRTITNNRLNVSNLNTGVYILRAEQDNAFTTRKLIIN